MTGGTTPGLWLNLLHGVRNRLLLVLVIAEKILRSPGPYCGAQVSQPGSGWSPVVIGLYTSLFGLFYFTASLLRYLNPRTPVVVR